MYGLSENVINFDLGPIGQGQIQGQILLKNCKFENIIFFKMEGIHRLISNFFLQNAQIPVILYTNHYVSRFDDLGLMSI